MRYLKSFITVILCLLTCSVQAETTTQSSNGFTVTTTNNVVKNGQTGYRFKVAMNVPGPDPSGAYLIVTICDMNGNSILVNGNQLYSYGSISLPYASNGFNNCELFISNSQLQKGNVTPSSPFKFYITVKSIGRDIQLKQSGMLVWNNGKSAGRSTGSTNTGSTNTSNSRSNKSQSASAGSSRKSTSYYLTVGFGNPKYGGGQWVGEGRNAKIFELEYDANTLIWKNSNYPGVKGRAFRYVRTTDKGARVYRFEEQIGGGMVSVKSRHEFAVSSDGRDLQYIAYSNNEYSSINYATSDRSKLQSEIAKYRSGVAPIQMINPNNGGHDTHSKPAPSGKRRCPGCNGTGHQRERIDQSDPHAITGKSARYWCEKCNGWFATKHNHYTPTCPVCHGKGYVD